MSASYTLPADWSWASPADLTSDERHSLGIGPFGSDLKVSDYTEHGVPLVFVRNIRAESFGMPSDKFISIAKAEQLRAHTVRPGDLLITKMGEPPGDACLYPADRPSAVMTADCIRLRLREELGPRKYFLYAVRSSVVQNQIHAITQGVAQKKISLERFKTVRIPLAPVHQRSLIAGRLDKEFSRLDAGVDALKRVQANLKRYRASVLKAACEGRLVPTEAELARRESRDYEPACVLLQRILKERRLHWEASELAKLKAKGKPPTDDRWKAKYREPELPDEAGLPELPIGWCWASVDQLGETSGGVTQNSKRERLGLQLPYLRVANVYANELRLDEVEQIGIEPSELARVLLSDRDLLVVEGNGSVDQIGRVAIWDGSVSPCVHQNHLIKVRFAVPGIETWTLNWLLSPEGRGMIERVASSTSGLHTLSLSKVGKFVVPLPPLVEQNRIVAESESRLSNLTAAMNAVAANLIRAQRLRQSILKSAFDGSLTSLPETSAVPPVRPRAVSKTTLPKLETRQTLDG